MLKDLIYISVIIIVGSTMGVFIFLLLLKNRKLRLEKFALDRRTAILKLLLNSTAEGIFGIDHQGYCTFCNTTSLKLLGFEKPEDLLGKSMHKLIHHSQKDGTPVPEEECIIYNAITRGEGMSSDNEVLWRSDGTCFDASYNAFPMVENGKVIGAVMTFTDITEKKKKDSEMLYLSFHDALTGLYNRRYYENELRNLDCDENLPISVISGDLNGLKLTNDIFGHAAGDQLLIRAAQNIKSVCGPDSVIARTGGDEFTIVLLKTDKREAEELMHDISARFKHDHSSVIPGSISLGVDTKRSRDEDLQTIISKAEVNMYARKTLERDHWSNAVIRNIMKSVHEKCPAEEAHSKLVSELSQQFGEFLKLSKADQRRLKDAGFYHDIGKIGVRADILNKAGGLSLIEKKEMEKHPVIGYRILNNSSNTVEISDTVLHHHEKWDGSGYPKGLRGESIPLLSRIIAITGSYSAMTEMNGMSMQSALSDIMKHAGTVYDPGLAAKFCKMLTA